MSTNIESNFLSYLSWTQLPNDPKSFALPESIRELARERLIQGGADLEQPPLWVGQFWNDQVANFATGLGSEQPGDHIDCTVQDACIVARINNVPTRRAIEEAVQFRPEARPLLELWRSIWERSFPDELLDEESADHRNEKPRASYSLSRFESLTEGLGKPRNKNMSLTEVLTGFVSDWQKVDKVTALPMRDARDYRLHIIDDAETVVGFRYLRAGFGTLFYLGKLFKLVGHSEDGLPMFERFERQTGRYDGKAWEAKRMEDHPEYWFWPSFQKYMGRRSIYAPSLQVAGALIADMAWQGHTHAFIKAARPKQGTWTVSLRNVRNIEDGVAALENLVGKKEFRHSVTPVIVQEHVPFTHEQRLFVIDGKLVASVCSDRNFCVADTRRNRRLDDRLAVLLKPSIDQGSYDRGITSHVIDRRVAAQFARRARQIARELKNEGHFDYVLDLGLTERGIVAVEINTVHFAGPYCMERQWLMKAYNRRRQRVQSELEAAVASFIPTCIADSHLAARAAKFKTEQFIELVLAGLMKQRREDKIEYLKSDIAERLLVKAIIGAKVEDAIDGR